MRTSAQVCVGAHTLVFMRTLIVTSLLATYISSVRYSSDTIVSDLCQAGQGGICSALASAPAPVRIRCGSAGADPTKNKKTV